MTVEIQVPADDVCTPMTSMRHWLDDVRFDPSTFAWDEAAGRTVVRLKFKIRRRPDHFAGRVLEIAG